MKHKAPAKIQTQKFFRTALPALAVLAGGTILIFSFFIYKISNPGSVPESVNPSHYLMSSLDVLMPSTKGKTIPAWWIPGLKGAPGIILAPGYGMNRSDALSLALALRQNGFNLLIFAQRGSGAEPRGVSSLGLFEAEDMLSAVEYLKGRPESDPELIGIWGVDVGAVAALKAAADAPEIRAIAADSVYPSPSDFLNYRIREDFGTESRIIQVGCYQFFRLVHLRGSFSHGARIPLQSLTDRSLLFIKGENRERLGDLTTQIHESIEPRKELISFKTARIHLMGGADMKEYDRQVTNFFQLNLK